MIYVARARSPNMLTNAEILEIPAQEPSPNGKKGQVIPAWHLLSPSGALLSSPLVAEHIGRLFSRYVETVHTGETCSGTTVRCSPAGII
jgi:hypothetical protein